MGAKQFETNYCQGGVMFEVGAEAATFAARENCGHPIRAEMDRPHWNEIRLHSGQANNQVRVPLPGSSYALIDELLELTGVLQFADCGWLCRISGNGALEELLGHAGPISKNEIADVLESLNGPVSLARASAPFRWLSGDGEYIIGALNVGLAGQTALFLRVQGLRTAEWPHILKATARAQRVIKVALSVGSMVQGHSAAALNDGAHLERSISNLCPFGIIVVDPDQNILFANAAAKTFFTGTAPVGSFGGKLAIFDSDDAVRVHVALRAVLSGRTQADAPHTIAVGNGNAGPILLSITKIAGSDLCPRACVMITDSTAGYQLHVQPLADSFALTSVETRVVMQLTEGRSVDEAAKRLKLKVATVRTYLKQIFQKTGTHRQLELIALMKAGALPTLAKGIATLAGAPTTPVAHWRMTDTAR